MAEIGDGAFVTSTLAKVFAVSEMPGRRSERLRRPSGPKEGLIRANVLGRENLGSHTDLAARVLLICNVVTCAQIHSDTQGWKPRNGMIPPRDTPKPGVTG